MGDLDPLQNPTNLAYLTLRENRIEGVAPLLFFVSENCEGGGIESCTDAAEVPDAVLNRERRAKLNKSRAAGPLTCGDLESFTEFAIDLLNVNDLAQAVSSLEGFQHAKNLEVLEITGAVSTEASLTPLRNLENLKRVSLRCADVCPGTENSETIEAL